MNRAPDLLHDWARETMPRSDEIADARRELHIRLGTVTPKALSLLPAASPREEAAVRDRVLLAGAPRVTRPSRALGLGIALAAALVLGLIGITRPRNPGADVARSQPVAISSPASTAAVRPVDGVTLRYHGAGVISGTDGHPEVEWKSGRVDIEVEPGRGIDLQVRTREGVVRVIGTIFGVERGPLGTEVTVSRGHVHVACERGGEHDLLAGDRVTCLPTSAAGLLARAHALADGGASPHVVLEAIELAKSESDGAVRSELALLEAAWLHAVGRDRDARVAVLSYLASGDPSRRADALRLAVQLDASCAEARPRLEELTRMGPTADDIVALLHCTEVGDRARVLDDASSVLGADDRRLLSERLEREHLP